MTDFSTLSRRERQIMQVVFSRQQASVQEIRMSLPAPPTPMAVRRMLAILCEKGHLRRQKRGREFLYLPRQSKDKAGRAAFRQVLGTFFNDSLGAALATHFESQGSKLSDADLKRLSQLVDELEEKRKRGES